MKDMIKDETCPMFDLDLMKYFYDPAYEQDEKVINAWYIYVLKILPIVSKGWKDATAPDKLRIETSMFKYITISDEAIMRWLLEIWIPKLTKTDQPDKAMKQTDMKNEHSDCSEENSKTPKKRGPHDTNVKIDMYTTLFHEIATARKNYSTAVRWNQIFWNEVKTRNASMLEENGSSNKRSKSFNYVSQLCLPDLNENQEFLASYNIDDQNSNNAMMEKCEEVYSTNNITTETLKIERI